ncbi:MAG TPA: DinB family protein [Ignavibacteriales bacterium]|nr:DinB family protein [Ignavibacteriales bacterium]
MELNSYLSEIFRQMSWADAAVWQSVLKTPGAEEDDSIQRMLYHMHATQHAFLSLWEDRPLEIPEPTSFPDLISIAKWAHAFHKEASEFIGGADEKELSRLVVLPWTYLVEEKLGKKPGEVTLEGSMLQVALHSSHHRGQINARVRVLGGEPPLIDFIGWLWFEKPLADWDFIYSLQNKEV